MKGCYHPYSYLFVNVGNNEIELKHRAQQKFLWFIFDSLASSCCSGRPVAAAQEGLLIKQNEQALIPVAAVTQVFWSCQATFLWPNVKQKLSKLICEVPQKVSELSEVFLEEKWEQCRTWLWLKSRLANVRDPTMDDWCQDSAVQLCPSWMPMAPVHTSKNHKVHSSWKGPLQVI